MINKGSLAEEVFRCHLSESVCYKYDLGLQVKLKKIENCINIYSFHVYRENHRFKGLDLKTPLDSSSNRFEKIS